MLEQYSRPNSERYEERLKMVEELRKSGGITDKRVLEAMMEVPRHLFVPRELQDLAYDPFEALDLGYEGSTISAPNVVAKMTEWILAGVETEGIGNIGALRKVAELGTGSGWQATILSRWAGRVHTYEINREVGEAAAKRMAELGVTNVEVRILKEYEWLKGDFDNIMVTASMPPWPLEGSPLLEFLRDGGRLVVPVGGVEGEVESCELVSIKKQGEKYILEERLGGFGFVPIRGIAGWDGFLSWWLQREREGLFFGELD